jgi:hypothetical protein
MTRPALWVSLRRPSEDPDGLAIAFGRGGDSRALQTTHLPAEQWQPLWQAYLQAVRYASQEDFTLFTQGPSWEVWQDAAELLRAARARLVQEALLPSLPDWTSAALLAHRTQELMLLPLAPLLADVHPQAALCFELPLDVHPSLPLDAVIQRAASPEAWPRPRPDELTLLVGDDLGQGEIFRSRSGEPDLSAELSAEDLVIISAYQHHLELGLEAAARQGVRIVRAFTSDDFLTSLEGGYGDCLQFIAELPAPGPAGAHLRCADGLVQLPRLQEKLQELRNSGAWRSPVRMADLEACSSSEALHSLFTAAGVPDLTSRPLTLHTGRICLMVRRLYERGLLDGKTPFAHAWIRAELSSLPPERGGGVSQRDEPMEV